MRAYRLLVIFNVTKKHFEDEETTEKDKVFSRFSIPFSLSFKEEAILLATRLSSYRQEFAPYSWRHYPFLYAISFDRYDSVWK